MKRSFSILFVLVLVLTFSLVTAVPVSAATTYTVDDDWQIGAPPYAEDTDGDNDFATIQAAINAASSGDTVYVRSGTYYEHVTIGKSLTLQGEDKDTTAIDGSGSGSVIYMTSSYVTVSGFTITNGDYGVNLITDYTINHITIKDVIITLIIQQAFYAPHSGGYHLIEDCIISNNYGASYAHQFGNSIIRNCEIFGNGGGLSVAWGSGTLITNNRVHHNGAGISFDSMSYSTIEKNEVYNNLGTGITVGYVGRYNTIRDNIVHNNTVGIVMNYSGVYGNKIYHNDLIENTTQALEYGNNIWDNGYPSGGNYWCDYAGVDDYSGPGQNLLGSDGIGDTPYVFVSNQDNYPLMTPWGEEELDFGDAPDSYGTLLASNGARHTFLAAAQFSLGPVVDTEPDGQPSALADGDDLNGIPDDEDGVTFPAPLVQGDPVAQVTVNVSSPSGGMLDAWIDFNGNGVFDHPAEHLWGATSQVLVSGSNPLTFAVPGAATPGSTYARFRLSINGNLPPTGCLAPDGEVEDYQVEIIEALPIMTIDKDVVGNPPVMVMPGGTVQYTINVTNTGTADALDVSIWDTLPAWFTYASTDSIVDTGATRWSTVNSTPGDTTPLWGYWDISSGDSVVITFTADVDLLILAGTYQNNAFADGDNFEQIDDIGSQGQDPGTPPGQDPAVDEDVFVQSQPPPPSAVPTLSQWGMIAMGILLVAALVWSVRRRWVVSASKS